MKFVPHEYQRRGASWLVQHPCAALFWQPGLGKTSVTLLAIKALRKAGAVRKALVVAPLRVAELVWTRDADGELAKWDDFGDLRVALLHGPKKLEALKRDADIYVVNYDALSWLTDAGQHVGLGGGVVRPGGALMLFAPAPHVGKPIAARALTVEFDPPEAAVGCTVEVSFGGRLVVGPTPAATYAKERVARWPALACGERIEVVVRNPGPVAVQVKAARFAIGFEAHVGELLRRGVDLVVFDELSKLKHTDTGRFRAIKPWLGRFRRRWGLTGSPCANSLLDVFAQAYCLDLGLALGPFITKFRQRYFVPQGFGGYTWAPQEGAEARIHAALAPLALSLRAEDCLELPELVERDIFVELPPDARREYDRLEDEMVATINNVEISAANKAVAVNKCRQMTSGAIYHDSSGPTAGRWERVHDAKLDALRDLVDELQGEPLLVAYEFTHELARIREVWGDDLPAIGGGATTRQVAAAVAAWNAGQLPLLPVHPASAGHGLNLQRGGRHVAWLTPTYDLELYDQLVHRVWRQGSMAARVVVHRILARRSVDLAVRAALGRKRGGQAALFAALRQPAWRAAA